MDLLSNSNQDDTQQLQAVELAIQSSIEQHFKEAHERVPGFYREYFLSPKHIAKRHWRHKRDIPHDIIAFPKGLWQTISRAWKNNKPHNSPVMTGKEQAILAAISNELLQLDKLYSQLTEHLHPFLPALQECETILKQPLNEEQRKAVDGFLQEKIKQLSGPREGGRDLILFLLIGAFGHHISTQATFGSALATGSALASTLYISQQSWWYGIWLQMAGVPGWVTFVGASTGLAAGIALAPLLSPLAELLINRIRGERFLHKLLDDIEQKSLKQRHDLIDTAGIVAGLSQLIPDLLALLRQLKA